MEARIATLEADKAGLQARIATLEADNAALTTTVEELRQAGDNASTAIVVDIERSDRDVSAGIVTDFCVRYVVAGADGEECKFTLLQEKDGVLLWNEQAARSNLSDVNFQLWQRNELRTAATYECWQQAMVGQAVPDCWFTRGD